MNQTATYGPRLVARPAGPLRIAALVRPPSAIENARTMPGEPGAIYVRALEQHAVFVKTLEFHGVKTIVLEPAGDDPYEAAAADAAIVFEDGALIARPTAMSRRGEADRMQVEFARLDVPIAGNIVAPGLLDGGDVLLAGTTAFVGVGRRGNRIGRSGFTTVARAQGYRVVEVAVAEGVTSLRSIAGAVSHDTVVLGADKLDIGAFEGFKTILLDPGESLAAGVLCLGEHHVLADTRYRTSLSIMRKAGLVVESIDLYEFAKIGVSPSMLALALKRD